MSGRQEAGRSAVEHQPGRGRNRAAGDRRRAAEAEGDPGTAQTAVRLYPDRLFAVARAGDAERAGRFGQRADSRTVRVFRAGRAR